VCRDRGQRKHLRVTECFGLEETFRGHLAHPPAASRDIFCLVPFPLSSSPQRIPAIRAQACPPPPRGAVLGWDSGRANPSSRQSLGVVPSLVESLQSLRNGGVAAGKRAGVGPKRSRPSPPSMGPRWRQRAAQSRRSVGSPVPAEEPSGGQEAMTTRQRGHMARGSAAVPTGQR